MIHKIVLLIIASDGYQPIEYGHTRKALEDAGIQVVVTSDKAGIAHASHAIPKQYATVKVDVVLADVDVKKYDGIFIIGGPGALDHLDNKVTYKIMQNAAKSGKLFGAICISPRILADAGVLRGKKATGWNDDNKLDNVFKKAGVTYVKNPVVIDDNIVTADGPSSAALFGDSIVKLLGL